VNLYATRFFSSTLLGDDYPILHGAGKKCRGEWGEVGVFGELFFFKMFSVEIVDN
jgi:hypothetical protein